MVRKGIVVGVKSARRSRWACPNSITSLKWEVLLPVFCRKDAFLHTLIDSKRALQRACKLARGQENRVLFGRLEDELGYLGDASARLLCIAGSESGAAFRIKGSLGLPAGTTNLTLVRLLRTIPQSLPPSGKSTCRPYCKHNLGRRCVMLTSPTEPATAASDLGRLVVTSSKQNTRVWQTAAVSVLGLHT